MDVERPEGPGRTHRLGRWAAGASIVLVVGALVGLLWLRTSGTGIALVSTQEQGGPGRRLIRRIPCGGDAPN